MGEVEIYSPLGAPHQGMRPYHSLVLAALVSLALAQEELGYDKLSYDELAELSYEKLEELSFEQLEEIEELSYVRLSYDAMLAAEDEKKAQAKGSCKRSGPKPTEKLFKPYTEPDKKCPCWWDLSKNNCACCKEGTDAMQCGWPMQKYCKSVQGDCRHISGACPPERCIKQGKVPGKPYKHLTYYECECADGYTGNGIQCMDANGTWAVSGDAHVELEMTLTSEVETFPFDPSTDLPTGVELQDLIDQMGSVDNTCSSGAGCTSSFNQATINN